MAIDGNELFEEIKKNNIPFKNYHSDLHIPVTKETKKIISNYQFIKYVTTFEVDSQRWYIVPFAYPLFWSKLK